MPHDQYIATLPPDASAEPTLSPDLGRILRNVIAPHETVAGKTLMVSQQMKDEANTACAVMETLCRPVTLVRIREWARPLGASINNAPIGKNYDIWAGSVLMACEGFAMAAFCPATRKEALLTFTEFWPSAGAIAKLVTPLDFELRGKRDNLRKIANAAVLPARREPEGPYTVPDWVDSRSMRKASGPVTESDARHSLAQLPVRTVEEQIRAMEEGNG